MKIILFSNSLEFSAVSMQLMELALFLQRKGDEVHMVTHETIDKDVFEHYQQNQTSLSMHSLACKRWQVTLGAKRFRYLLKRIQPDLVHCHLGRACIIAALCKGTRVALLATFHNRRQYFGVLTRIFLRVLLGRFDGITAVSQDTLKGYCPEAAGASGAGGAAETSKTAKTSETAKTAKEIKTQISRVIYNPIQKKRIRREEKEVEMFGSDRVSIGVANRFVQKKGYEYWARLVDDLRKSTGENGEGSAEGARGLAFEFWAAGEGPLREQYQKRAGLQEVHFLGFRTDLMELIQKTDLMLYPTQDEGFGLLLYETLSMGVPILAQDLPVFRELLGENSPWLVNFRDPQAVLEQSLHMIRNREEAVQRAKKEGLWIQERLSPERILSEYYRFYQDCLESASGAARR